MRIRKLENELRRNTLTIILCVASFLTISILFYISEKRMEHRLVLKRLAESLKTSFEMEVKSTQNNLTIYRNFLLDNRNLSADSFRRSFLFWGSNLLAPHKTQYNIYLALKEPLSFPIFKKKSAVLTLFRKNMDEKLPDFYSPRNFSLETFFEPDYEIKELNAKLKTKEGHFSFSKAFFEKAYLKKWMILGELPLYEKGELIATVGIDLTLDTLTSFIRDFEVGKTGGAILIDERDFRVLGSSGPFELIKNNYSILPISSMDELIPYLETLAPTSNFYTEVSLDDAPFRVIVFQSKSEIHQTVYYQLYFYLLLIILLFIILLLLDSKLGKRILTPLSSLIYNLKTDAVVIKERGQVELTNSKIFKIKEFNDLQVTVNELKRMVNRNFEYYKTELSDNEKLVSTLDERVYQQTRTLEKRNKELEKLLNDLKATQEKLIGQEKFASLGNLTAGIAHEIKNPLNLLLNGSEILLNILKNGEDEDKEIFNQLVFEINRNSKRLSSIVNSMLGLARNVGGEREFCNIKELVSEVTEFTLEAYRAKYSFVPIIDLKGLEEFQLFVSKESISRAIVNVVDNSLHALKEKYLKNDSEAILKIFTKKESDSIELHFKDNGIGILKENIQKIFDPFYTTKAAGEGTGLGMSFVFDIMGRHDGEVKVDSLPGHYTDIILVFNKTS